MTLPISAGERPVFSITIGSPDQGLSACIQNYGQGILPLRFYAPDGTLYHPLHVAVLTRDLKAYDQLLAWGADVDALTSQRHTALHLFVGTLSSEKAETATSLQLFSSLLRHSRNVNAKDSEEKTPLHHVLSHLHRPGFEHWEIIESLLANGADHSVRDLSDACPISHLNNLMSSLSLPANEARLVQLHRVHVFTRYLALLESHVSTKPPLPLAALQATLPLLKFPILNRYLEPAQKTIWRHPHSLLTERSHLLLALRSAILFMIDAEPSNLAFISSQLTSLFALHKRVEAEMKHKTSSFQEFLGAFECEQLTRYLSALDAEEPRALLQLLQNHV